LKILLRFNKCSNHLYLSCPLIFGKHKARGKVGLGGRDSSDAGGDNLGCEDCGNIRGNKAGHRNTSRKENGRNDVKRGGGRSQDSGNGQEGQGGVSGVDCAGGGG